MPSTRRVTVYIWSLLLLFPFVPTRADEPSQPNWKERIAGLEEKLQDAKAAGREEEARELAAQLEQVRREAKLAAEQGNPEKPAPKKVNPEKASPEKTSPEKVNPEKVNPEKKPNPEKKVPEKVREGAAERPALPEDMARKIEQAKRKIEELRNSGQLDEARAMAQELEKVMRAWRLQGEPGERERREQALANPETRERFVMETRRRALMMAAEQLAEAGLPDQAELLRRQANEFHPLPERATPDHEGTPAPIRELHEKMQGLNERIERLEQTMQRMTRILEELSKRP